MCQLDIAEQIVMDLILILKLSNLHHNIIHYKVFNFLKLSLSAKYLCDNLSRNAVEQNTNEGDEQQEEQSTDDVPLVVIPDDEFEGLPGGGEPHERRFRSTTRKTERNENHCQIRHS